MQQVANRQLFEGKKEPQTLVKSGLAAFPRTRTRESMHAARPGSPARVVVLRYEKAPEGRFPSGAFALFTCVWVYADLSFFVLCFAEPP